MNQFKKLLLPLVALTAVSDGVMADAQEGEFYFSPLASYLDDNSEKGYDGDSGAQIGFGLVLSEGWNAEGYLSRFTPEGVGAQDQQVFGIDFQRVFRRSEMFSPYLFVGAGIMDVTRHDGTEDTGAGTMSAGIGFLTDFSRDGRAALRVEYRRRADRAFSVDREDDIVSIGLQFPVGRESRRVRDDDNDGVENALDQCPGTPAGTVVDARGCPLPADSDRDGVVDTVDACPDTPAGTAVDARGCALDTDSDGVADSRDRCPNTVAGAVVGEDGCELDTDGDGVVDRLDRCPGTRRGAPIDVYGCEIREEIQLPGVTFRTNSAELLPTATTVLADAARTLQNNPDISVEVAGHTDSDGAADYNESLSEQRANSVRQFLIDRGVAPTRLSARGYGETQPVADNSTAAGKQQNRRVVLRVLSAD